MIDILHIHALAYDGVVNILWLFVIGICAGFLSGVFGIGGGIVTTPALSMLGVPLNIVTTTNLLQVAFISLVNTLSRLKEKAIEYKLAFTIIFFAAIGNIFGIKSLVFFKSFGKADLFISVSYVVIMFALAAINILDGVKIKKHEKHNINSVSNLSKPVKYLLTGLCGSFSGFLMPIMGIGGGFIIVPFLIKVLKINKNKAVCTSAFQMLFTSIFTVILSYFNNMMFDILIAAFIMPTSFFAVKIGGRLSKQMVESTFRFLLAGLMIFVCLFFAFKSFMV